MNCWFKHISKDIVSYNFIKISLNKKDTVKFKLLDSLLF